jgi:hypothetical protein
MPTPWRLWRFPNHAPRHTSKITIMPAMPMTSLKDLTGVLNWRPARGERAVVHSVVVALRTRTLAEADPVPLERPPKAFPSI